MLLSGPAGTSQVSAATAQPVLAEQNRPAVVQLHRQGDAQEQRSQQGDEEGGHDGVEAPLAPTGGSLQVSMHVVVVVVLRRQQRL